MVAMSVPPCGATGNCPLLRAEPNTDTRVQATGPCDRPVYEHPCHITWLMVLHVSRDYATASAGADAHKARRKTRVATLNVDTLSGRSFELAEVLERRKVDFCAVTSDRLMKIVVAAERRMYHLFPAYAPQTGCSERDKDEFWSLLNKKTAEVPSLDVIIVAGDLNGHVGATKDGYCCHGGFGYGSRNVDNERILEYAKSHNLTNVNTKFRKRASHLTSFYSGNAKTQIDFVLVRNRDQELVTDAKIVPYETVATQHRPLICTMKIAPLTTRQIERGGPARIKWWRLKENEAAVTSRIWLPTVTTVEETWRGATEAMLDAARSALGTTGVDRQSWLWTNKVKKKVREKKRLYHAFLSDKTAEKYQEEKKSAKRAVAVARATHYDDVNERLESRDGGRILYRLANFCHRQTEDVEKFFGINDENGHLLMDRKMALNRWRNDFEEIPTVEFAYPAIPSAPPVYGPVQEITVDETEAVLRKMKPGKATVPDDLAADL
ncbi:unnamed protein product [Heligmosomoides polygyrus]|uniref:Reverse transcriptase domain-containing protein n=1 Tax=Heligmosomoides polygyrus TaxID=6339 RepID=A0A183G859_HELPZ|nr:unnamed protein product [Heligmosomoides polygyrus]